MGGVKGVKHLVKATPEHNIYHMEVDDLTDVDNEIAMERLNQIVFGGNNQNASSMERD